MKLHAIEVTVDSGRRVLKIEPPLELEATLAMPEKFRSLTELLWGLVHKAEFDPPQPTTPRAEA